MPTVTTAFELNEGQQTQESAPDVIKQVLLRFPYKEYGIAEDKRDGALVVTFPNGMKIRMHRTTVEYYGDMAQVEQKDDFTSSISEIDKALTMPIKDRAIELKKISKRMSHVEYKPDKYSFFAYILGNSKLPIESVKSLYMAHADENPETLDQELRGIYEKSINYCLMYYKFIIGMLAILG